jgi:predicted extracellular nuclease
MKKNYILTLLMTICMTVASYGQYSDLFISMYAEGSSSNKFIEIYNGTGSSIDLSNYMIKGTNNGGDWKEARNLSLTGSISDGDVYVIAADQADASILAVADLSLSYESALHYNGDDAIALLKKNDSDVFEVIDIIGATGDDPGSGWAVAGVTNATKDHTLSRKNTISGPSSDWTSSAGTDESSSEWVVTGKDTEWTSLGSYTGKSTASLKNNAIIGFATYPNPVSDGILNISSASGSVKNLTIFNLLGKQVLSSSFSGVNKNIDVSSINTGMYILKVTEEGKIATKKLIIR